MVDAQVEGVLLDEEIAVQAVTGFVAVVKRTDVAAGTEAFRAFAAQHHGMYLIINRPGVELLLKAANHVQGQGVEASRAVEGQVTDMVANLGQNRRRSRRLNVRGHRCLPALLLIFQVNCHDLDRRSKINGSYQCKFAQYNRQNCRLNLHFCMRGCAYRGRRPLTKCATSL
ncbi:hypothetical protein D3C78_912130 [compost metagenome]